MNSNAIIALVVGVFVFDANVAVCDSQIDIDYQLKSATLLDANYTRSKTSIPDHDNSTTKDEVTSALPEKYPIEDNIRRRSARQSFFGGSTGNAFIPQTIPSGNPWPARPEDYKNFSNSYVEPQLSDRYQEKYNNSINVLYPNATNTPNRPSFFGGSTGSFFIPQSIKPGKPWPSKIEDYQNIGINNNRTQLEDKLQLPLLSKPETEGYNKPQIDEQYSNITVTSLSNNISQDKSESYPWLTPGYNKTTVPDKFEEVKEETPSITIKPPSKLPSYFGGTTGNAHIPQTIKPGKPWPARPEDYPQNYSTHFNYYNNIHPSNQSNLVSNLENVWPDKEQNYTLQAPGDNNVLIMNIVMIPEKPVTTKHKLQIQERYSNETTSTILLNGLINNKTSNNRNISIYNTAMPLQENSQIYPWLTPGYNKTEFTGTFVEVTEDTPSITIKPPSKLPSFFGGSTGAAHIPQSIQPGKPWPAKPQDLTTTKKPQIDERYSNETATSINPPNKPIDAQNSPGNSSLGKGEDESKEAIPTSMFPSNRPSFFGGSTGSANIPQTIGPGTPWPAKLEDLPANDKKPLDDRYQAESLVSSKPSNKQNITIHNAETPLQDKPQTYPWLTPGYNKTEFTGTFVEVKEDTPSITIKPPSKPPSFFGGSTGAAHIPQSIQPGKPWPAKPQDLTTTKKPQIDERYSNETATSINPPNKPIDAQNSPGNSSLGKDEDESKEAIPTSMFSSNRPSFFGGSTGSANIPQTIGPGKPWPAKLEDYPANDKKDLDDRYQAESVISSKPSNKQNISIHNAETPLQDKPHIYPLSSGYNKTEAKEDPSSNTIKPPTGAANTSQSIQPGKPWPAKSEELTTIKNPQIIERDSNENSTLVNALNKLDHDQNSFSQSKDDISKEEESVLSYTDTDTVS